MHSVSIAFATVTLLLMFVVNGSAQNTTLNEAKGRVQTEFKVLPWDAQNTPLAITILRQWMGTFQSMGRSGLEDTEAITAAKAEIEAGAAYKSLSSSPGAKPWLERLNLIPDYLTYISINLAATTAGKETKQNELFDRLLGGNDWKKLSTDTPYLANTLGGTLIGIGESFGTPKREY